MGYATKTASLNKGITKVGAFKVHTSDQHMAKDGVHRLEYAYFADETESYWLVTEDSLFRLGARNLDYNEWAESDTDAEEFGKRSPRRAE